MFTTKSEIQNVLNIIINDLKAKYFFCYVNQHLKTISIEK